MGLWFNRCIKDNNNKLNYGKVDPMLAYELKTNLAGKSKNKNELYSLFIEIDPQTITSLDKETLTNMGIMIDDDTNVLTASLSAEQIDILTNKPWIKFISKSHKMKFYK